MTGDLNGTYDLPRTGDCTFNVTTSNVGWTHYANGTCSGGPDVTTSSMTINLIRDTNTNWKVLVDGVYPSPFLSNTNTVPSGDCTTSFTATNGLTNCNPAACVFPAGIGGTASVTLHYA